MKRKTKRKKANTVQSVDNPAEKKPKISSESEESTKIMKRTEGGTKRKSYNPCSSSSTAKVDTTLCTSFAACSSSTERKQKEKKDEAPKLNIDLDKLFSMDGIRANGSHLHCNDIKNLLLHTVLGPGRWEKPNWCNIVNWNRVNHALLVMVGYISGDEYTAYKSSFQNLNRHFNQGYPVKNDGSEGVIISPVETYLNYRMKKKSAKQKFRNTDQRALPAELILTKEQRIANEFPMFDDFSKEDLKVYVSTQDCHIGDMLDKSRDGAEVMKGRLFAIDCEMCDTVNGKEVTRISVVNEDLEVVYDTFVKPDAQITDYITQYSGITEDMLANVKIRLGDVQQSLLDKIFADDILVGHSLDNDLRCLKIFHDNVIDTSVIYGDQRGARFKPPLRRLVKEHLKREIQNSQSGHCSIEDAKACMELVKLKIEKGKHYGLFDQPNESIFEAFSRANKTSALVDTATVARQHCFTQTHAVLCSSDKDVVRGTRSYINKTDFVFSHLKQFENLKKDYDKRGMKLNDAILKATVGEIDDNLGKIMESLPKDTLTVVLFSSGFLPSAVHALQRDREKRKTDFVKIAVKKAKDCLCFIKVTE